MIAFGSQRANGADLATHLANAEENEYVEYAVHGTLADDLHGAFAEIEAQAHAMTNLKNYLYSLSVNPDPRQPWTQDMFDDYISRAGQTLGLEDQPHAIAKHIKEGQDGTLREHRHVVWSRVDTQNSCGINISYDRLKLMGLAREFAQDYGLALPEGYYRARDNHEQTSLYEAAKQVETGISKSEHRAVVTDLWRRSDSPKAFVAALEDRGYMLATGKRPYVLVDTFGKMHALPRLIDDKQVRTQDVENYLRRDFPPESLSSVAEAREVAAQLDQQRARLEMSQKLAEQQEILERDQDTRRQQLQADIEAKQAGHLRDATRLSDTHADRLYVQKLERAQQDMEINFDRAAHAPSGLAGFLSRVTGMDAIRSKFHHYQDRKREAFFEQSRLQIEDRNCLEQLEQSREQSLDMLEMRRLETEQTKSFEREQRSIELAQERQKVAYYSQGYEHMPSATLDLKPPGRMAVPAKAVRRHYAPTVKAQNSKAKSESLNPVCASTMQEGEGFEKDASSPFTDGNENVVTPPPISEDFAQAADPHVESGKNGGDFIDPSPDTDQGRSR